MNPLQHRPQEDQRPPHQRQALVQNLSRKACWEKIVGILHLSLVQSSVLYSIYFFRGFKGKKSESLPPQSQANDAKPSIKEEPDAAIPPRNDVKEKDTVQEVKPDLQQDWYQDALRRAREMAQKAKGNGVTFGVETLSEVFFGKYFDRSISIRLDKWFSSTSV